MSFFQVALLVYSSYYMFLPKHSPFSFPLFPPNIPDSFCRTGSCLVETILPTLDYYRLTHHGCDRWQTEGKKKKSLLKKPSKQALVYPPTFASSETPKQESFKVALKTERAWFFSKKKERGLQSSPSATPGRMDGTLKGCLVGKFPYQKDEKRESVLAETIFSIQKLNH